MWVPSSMEFYFETLDCSHSSLVRVISFCLQLTGRLFSNASKHQAFRKKRVYRWINNFLRFPNSSAIFEVLPTLTLDGHSNLEPTAVEWGRDPKVNHHIEGHGSESGAWNLRLLSWRFRRQHSVVTVVYKGCCYGYTFAGKTWSLWVGGRQDGRSSSQTAPHGPSQQVGDGMCRETEHVFFKDIPEKWRLG